VNEGADLRRSAGRVGGARLDSANRSFFALVATSLVPYVLLGIFGCGVLSLAAHRLVTDGLAGLNRDGQDLRPAVVFFAVVTGGTLAAGVSVRRQVRATRALASSLRERSVPPSAAVTAAAERSGLAGRVDVADDPDPFSFTYGVLASRVALSRGLVDMLADDQLEAVLHHERYHVRNRDTLKMVIARAAPAAFFFLPALGYLQARYLAGRELAADRQATRALGARPLAGALFQVLDQPAWSTFGAAAALGGSEFLDLRVRQLETGDEPPLTRLPRWAVAVTTVGLTALSAAFLLTVARTGGSMPMMDGSASPGGGLAILGMVACSTAWIWVALLVVHSAMRHNP
jgi:Zn-dependent protease with chaperone function